MLIRVLGPLRVIDRGVTVQIGPPRVQRAFARLLVDRGRFVSVDALLDAVWGDGPLPKRPEKAVQDVMSDLRRVVGQRLATRQDGRAYRLELAASECDASLLVREIRAARAALAARDLRRAAALFEQAAKRFDGDPFEDVGLEEFALAESRRLEDMRWEAIEGGTTVDVILGRPIDLASLPTLVEAQPSRWRLWAAWMIELHRLGRQADALSVYQDAAARFGRRGLDPPRELRELDGRIAVEDPTLLDVDTLRLLPQAHSPLPPMVGETAGVHVVGREPSLAQLRDVWAACVTGSASLAAVTGEEGIGKSSVIGAFAREVAAAGGLVLAGRSLPTAAASYQPLAEALAIAVETRGVDIADDPILAPLVRLMPGVGALPTTPPGDAEHERLAMFRATVELLERLTEGAPVLLVLDDLHFMDAAAAALIGHLVVKVRRLRRLLLVLGYRSDELAQGHPLREVLELVARTPCVRIGLGGLDADALTELVRVALPDSTDEQHLGRAIALATDGHPLFADEVIRQLAALHISEGRVDASALSRLAIPEGIRVLVDRRLAALDATTRQVLTVAAVIGHEIPVWLLEDVVPGGRESVLDAIDRAMEAGIVVEQSSAGGDVAFRHGYFQRTIYAATGAARRLDLHLRIGRALAGRTPRASDRSIAKHLLAAGSLAGREELTDTVCRAALDAGRRLDAEEARRLLGEVQERLVQDAGENGRLVAQVLLTLASVERLTGDVQATKTAALRAWFEARGCGDVPTLVAAAVEHATFGGSDRADDDTSIDLLQRSLQLVTVDADRARLLARIAYHHAMWSSGSDEALQVADEAVSLSAGQDDRGVLALSLWAAAASRQGDPDARRRLDLGVQVVDLALELDDDRALANGQRVVALSSLELGDLAGFNRAVARMERVATVTRSWIYAADVARWQGLRAMAVGDWALADEAIERQREYGGNVSIYPASHAGQRLLFRRERGDLVGARSIAERAVDALSDVPALDAFRCVLALIASEMGDEVTASTIFSSYFDEGRLTLARGRTYPTALAALCEVCARLGDAERSGALLEAIDPYAGQLLVVSWGEACLGAADRYRALALVGQGAERQALDLFAQARDLEHRMGFRPLVARTDLWLAHLLHRLGEAGATTAQERVRRAATDLGMPQLRIGL